MEEDIRNINLNLNELKELLYENEKKLTYWINLVRCYEANVERVEPLSEEFEKTMEGIFRAQDQVKAIGQEVAYIRYNIGIREYYKK